MAGRRVLEGTQTQGQDEAIQYRLNCTPPAASVIAVTVWDETTVEDVTGDVTTGTATVSSGAVLLPVLHSLTARHVYRVEVRYSDGTNTLEPYFVVAGER